MKSKSYTVKTFHGFSDQLFSDTYQFVKKNGRHLADDLRWNKLVEITFKKKMCTTAFFDVEGHLSGICNWHKSFSIFGRNTVIAGPYAGLGGMVCLPEAEQAFVNEMLTFSNENVSALVVRTQIQNGDAQYLVDDELVFFEKRIGMGEILNELDKKVRYEVQRSLKRAQMILEIDKNVNTKELSDFFAKTFQILGTPFFGEKYLSNLDIVYKDDVFFVRLRDQNSRLIGVAVLIKMFDSIHVLHANTNKIGQRMGAGYRLYYEILKISQNNGAIKVNFGRSIKGSTQASFKRKWGMREHSITFVRTKDSPKIFNYKKKVIKHDLFVWLWRHAPFWVVRLAGPLLSKLLF